MFRPHRPAFAALIVAPLAVLIAAGCGDDDTAAPPTTTTAEPTTTTTEGAPAPDLTGLAPSISCGDAVIVFATPDDTALLRVEVPGLLARAEAEGGPFTLAIDLADGTAEATATLESGTALGTTACNDVPDPAYEVTGSWLADEGTVTVDVADVPDGPLEVCVTPIEVTVAIEDVAVTVDGTPVEVPDLTHEGAVGWCPG